MKYHEELPVIEVWTEGKTDWMHLKTALRKLEIQLPIKFHESIKARGDAELLKNLKTFAQRDNSTSLVFIFDHDTDSIVREVNDPHNNYKSWSNNVYSFAIPKPAHRMKFKNVSIEMLYSDKELHTEDEHGRRIFLTAEFNGASGKLHKDKLISVGDKGVLKHCSSPETAKIVPIDVYDANDVNIALSKAQFVKNIASDVSPFGDFDFSAFQPIFNILSEIADIAKPERNVYLPDFEQLFRRLDDRPPYEQLSTLYLTAKRLMILALEVFTITTVRFYEEGIVGETTRYKKKALPIKKLLKDNFYSPKFNTIRQLAEKCTYLIDNNAPAAIHEMKNCLEDDFYLEDLGRVLDDLELLFPPKRYSAIQTNKAGIRRSLLKYVMSEFGNHDRKYLADLELEAEQFIESGIIEVDIWKQALLQLAERIGPMISLPVELRTISSVDPHTGKYTVEIRTYQENTYSIEEEVITSEETEQYQTNYSQVVLEKNLQIHTFPMLLVKDNALYFYTRSRASGYEYYSLVNDRVHIEQTKKKFNHSLFKSGSTQEFFWTDVPPTTNPDNGIRANIPQEGLDDFVGRKQQKKIIREEILEIPMYDGIVFGPGGIGKTALMQQVTRDLFNNSSDEDKLFDNIIWISTKRDYYDHIFGTIEKMGRYSSSFDDILSAVLEFYEFEDLEEYGTEDKKDLVAEVLAENRTLLVLDNFETIPESDVKKITRFFGIEVKQRLRNKPNYFKIIITSRKQIPSGFQQIQLKGLDLRESRRLMRRLQERYRVENQFDKKQEAEIYDATQGIPIVLKHCFGQLFEYKVPLRKVLRELTLYKTNIVQFSYKEILQRVERSDRSGIQLKVLILLELLDYPLMIHRMAEILDFSEKEIEEKLPLLSNFQCLQTVYLNDQEKYALNDEIRLLTKSLAQKHTAIVNEIRKQIKNNFIEQELEATDDELNHAQMFENYLADGHLLDAEDFINSQLSIRPSSVLLNYHYARYLLTQKNECQRSIELLENIREISNNHPKVLSLLVKGYMSSEFPRYEDAQSYVIELENSVERDQILSLQIAEYYTDWSSRLKSRRELDHLDDQIRVQNYKSLADKAIDVLDAMPYQERSERYYYLRAYCFYNKWNYDTALRMIDKAIELADVSHAYLRFRKKIVKTRDWYTPARFKKQQYQ